MCVLKRDFVLERISEENKFRIEERSKVYGFFFNIYKLFFLFLLIVCFKKLILIVNFYWYLVCLFYFIFIKVFCKVDKLMK